MNARPIPVVFEPLFKPKPWGGRRLAELFDKRLPAGEAIGESWELVSLPGNESRVKGGPLAGRSLSELVEGWGSGLYGEAELVDGRFPLLIKFLDAREDLSVQVHPKPAADGSGWQPGVKHEAWYVLAADAGAEILVGLKQGVRIEDVARAANTPRTAELLRRWPARVGDCFYLPSGIVHALGAGVVVAEIQTPSDVTYRLYDWQRVGLDGRPRELHIEQALENIRLGIGDDEVMQPQRRVSGPFPNTLRATTCERFVIDAVHLEEGSEQAVPSGWMLVWIVLAGRGVLRGGGSVRAFGTGEVVLIPADNAGTCVTVGQACDLLVVTLPGKGGRDGRA